MAPPAEPYSSPTEARITLGASHASGRLGSFAELSWLATSGDAVCNAYDATSGNFLGALQIPQVTPIAIPPLGNCVRREWRTHDANTLLLRRQAFQTASTVKRRHPSAASRPLRGLRDSSNAAGGQSRDCPEKLFAIAGPPRPFGPAPLSQPLSTDWQRTHNTGPTSRDLNTFPHPFFTLRAPRPRYCSYGIRAPQTASVELAEDGASDNSRISRSLLWRVARRIHFQTQSGTGQAVVLNRMARSSSAANPLPKGSAIVLFATGRAGSPIRGAPWMGWSHPPTFQNPRSARNSHHPADKRLSGTLCGSSTWRCRGVMEVEALVPAAAASGCRVVLNVGSIQPGGVT